MEPNDMRNQPEFQGHQSVVAHTYYVVNLHRKLADSVVHMHGVVIVGEIASHLR